MNFNRFVFLFLALANALFVPTQSHGDDDALRQEFVLHEGYADGGRKVSIPSLSPPVGIQPIHSPELNFENPVWCGALPGTASDLLVVEHMTRRIWRLIRDAGPMRKELFLELGDDVHTGANQGLMCIAFHPQFVKNRRYFLEYEVEEDGQLKTTVAERLAAPNGIASFGIDQRGEIYLVTYKGTIYHVDLAGSVFPATTVSFNGK